MAVSFYDVHAEPFGALSNFSKHPFTLGGVWYPTAEHAFQAAKFAGTPRAEAIRRQRGAKDAARLARESRSLVRADWDAFRDDAMRQILAAKFAAHEPLRDLLIGTGAEPIEFASPMDGYWGTGRGGTGENRLGALLIELRAALAASP